MKTKKIFINLIPLFTVIFVIVLYALLSYVINNDLLLPSLKSVFFELKNILCSGAFYVAFSGTLIRSIISFVLSFIISIFLAILSSNFIVARKIIAPIISILRAIPTVAVVLLLLFWTSNNIAPIIVTMLVILPTLFTNAKNSISSIDTKTINALKLFNVSKNKILYKVIVPQIMPDMLYSAGNGLSLNIKLMVAAEVLASTGKSLGNMINIANYNLEIANMMALVLISVLSCVIIEYLFSLISKKVGKWND